MGAYPQERSFDLAPYGFITLASAIPVLVLAGAALGLHLKNRVPGLGMRDSVRVMLYLTQYDGAREYQGLGSRD